MAFKRPIKSEIRIIGWDDVKHTRKTKSVLLVGVIYRGASFLDGMLSCKIKKDGFDSTENIAASIRSSRHYDQLSIIMTDGITFGGFNIVDIRRLYKLTKLPVIAIQRKQPNIKEFLAAIKTVFPKHWKKQFALVKRTGKVKKYQADGKLVYYQAAGLSKKNCKDILKLTCTHGNMPEPIRVAHLIASGLSGESRGRA